MADVNHYWDPHKRDKPPGTLGQALNQIRLEQPQGTMDGGVHPLLVVAANLSNLGHQGP